MDALLPIEELQQHIFSFIDKPEDLANLALVDKKRYRLVTDPFFLRNKIKKLAANTWIMQLASLNDCPLELRCLCFFTLKQHKNDEEMFSHLKTQFIEIVSIFTSNLINQENVQVEQKNVSEAIDILSMLFLILDKLPTESLKIGCLEGTLPTLAKKFASYLLNSVLSIPELESSPDHIPRSLYRLADREVPAEAPTTIDYLQNIVLSKFKLFETPRDGSRAANENDENETSAAQLGALSSCSEPTHN